MVLIAAAFAAGCDTTAKISFPSRSFDEMHSTGMIAPAEVCGNLGEQGGSTTKLRFAMVADDGTPIRPARKGGAPLDSGEVQLTKDDVGYSGAGAIYETPDLSCTAGSCSSQYQCSVAVQDGPNWMQRCNLESTYSVEDVGHVADVDKHQFFGVLAEDAGSLEGFVADNIAQKYYDADGDGSADADHKVQKKRIARATDNNNDRLTAIKKLVPNWSSVRQEAFAEDRRTFFGLWTFNDVSGNQSMIDEASEEEGTIWTEDPDIIGRATTGTQDNNTDGVYPAFTDREGTHTRGNVLESMNNLIDDMNNNDQLADSEKTLIVFTDGPPELHPDRSGVNVDDVIQAAIEANVRIFMVHLDGPAVERNSEGKATHELVLDDPQYYGGQQETCESDGDCAMAHETCRQVRGYHPDPGGDVTDTTSGGIYPVGQADPDAKFCMPQRREDGRTGPLAIYSRIACATEGGYQYIKSIDDLSSALKWLPYTLDGLWEADVDVRELQRGNYTSNAAIRLQAKFNVQIGDKQVSLDVSQDGGDVDENAPETGDERSVVVTGD